MSKLQDTTFIVGATVLEVKDRITRPYRTRKYNKMIAASQAKLRETTPVSYSRVIA